MKTNIKEKAAMLLISDGVAMSSSFVISLFLGHKARSPLTLLSYYHWGFTALLLSIRLPRAGLRNRCSMTCGN